MGRGEAAPSARYNEFIEGITKILEEGISLPDTMNDPVEFSNVVLPQSKGIKSLEVALSMAIWIGGVRKRESRFINILVRIQTKHPKHPLPFQ